MRPEKSKIFKRLAIIPARGGSKRIPQKNIRSFCGKPMIGHILDTAKQSNLFDKIHVSTDSEEIRLIVEDLGFPIDFLRPTSLADDYTGLMPVIKFVNNTYASQGQLFEEVWLLMACAPLIEPIDLQNAANFFEQSGGNNPLLAVAEYPVPPEWAFTIDAANRLTPVESGMFSIRSQDLEKKYFDAGIFVVYSSSTVQTYALEGEDKNFLGFPIHKLKAIDIDDEVDWIIAETLYRYVKPNS